MNLGDVAHFESDGWVSVPGPSGGGVHARFRRRDGRVVVTEMYVHAEAITPATLRAIPIGRIEALANSPRAAVESHGNVEGIVLTGPLAALAAVGPDREVSLTELRERVPTPESGPAKPQRKPLERPDGRDPDAFSRLVATAYTEAVAETSAPAVALAAEADVPVGTVHRWIREARRRGHLPPARRGRAG